MSIKDVVRRVCNPFAVVGRLMGGGCDLAEMLCCWRSGHTNIRPIGDELGRHHVFSLASDWHATEALPSSVLVESNNIAGVAR